MSTHELLREGEWTPDGRMITPETVSWMDSIPLLTRETGLEGFLIGAVDNIRREGNKILGDCTIDLPSGKALTVECNYGAATEVAPGRVEMTGVRIIAANVSESKFYPWKEEGGEADVSHS
jgi:hypothetical protein